MDLDLFRRIIQQVAPLTELVCFHLMGDPLVHPKLPEMIAICAEYNAKIFLVTNGVLLREKQSEWLLHPAFHQVNFSLHSFTDNFGDKDPTDYLHRIFSYTEEAFVRRPDLYINYRLWNLNDPRGSATSNHQMLERIAAHFQTALPQNLDVRIKKSIHVKNRLFLHFDTEFIWPSTDLPILGTRGSCYGLSSHFGILVDGTVVPCCLDKEAAIPLGKVQDRPILDILGDSRAQNILSGFQAKRLVEDLCQRCQYIERFA
jgi:MoaA/NifB/PqqE/SkfB family radical SAM enzyme